ncbi:MAG: helix-turn-helix domain-containing protein [Vicingaceae bacterium]
MGYWMSYVFLETYSLTLIDQKSIAVLPLKNLSSDEENEYFADGMTEEIIYALSKIGGLKVTARTSSFIFKDKKEDVRSIGNKLGVSTVLEGSIRKSGNRIRITAQLIRTDKGFHIWSESFDRKLSDIFELQDEISLIIADKIRENFGHLNIQDQLVESSTKNIEAYELYLKGRFYLKKWNLEDIARGAQYFEDCIKQDPKYDLAYFGAGLCYGLLGSWGYMNRAVAFQKAEFYFAKGKAIDIESVYAYHCMATQEFWGLWHYKTAYEYLQKALQINPDEPDINECLAEVYTAIGDFDSALRAINTSLVSDPLSPNHFYTKANSFYLQKKYDQALELIEKSLELDPSFALAIQLKISCYLHLGRLEELYNQPDFPSIDPICYLLMEVLKGNSIDRREADRLIDQFHESKPSPLFAWDLYLLAQLDEGKALKLLEKQTSEQFGLVINFKHEPFLTKLRDKLDFQSLVEKYFPFECLQSIESKPKLDSKSVLEDTEVEFYQKELHRSMLEEECYLSNDLTLKKLAELLDLHPNKLSWLLNEKLGKNFNEYINSYRLEAFQKLAVDPKNSHLTLLGLAFESGFTSKSVFNDFFKKSTGLTPKAWLKQQRA